MSSSHDVVVVGAGIAGLYASYLLQKQGYNVLLVEANNYLGGRMKQIKFFSSHPLDIGGEFIHGTNVLLGRLADEFGWKKMKTFTSFPDPEVHTESLKEKDCIDWFYLGKERKFLPYNTTDPDVKNLINIIWNMGNDQPDRKEDITLMKYLVDKGIPLRVVGLADVIYAKTWAGTIDTIGLKESQVEEKKLVHNENGSHNYTLKDSMEVVTKHFSKDLNFKKNWRVANIDHTGSDIKITNYNGETVSAKRVVVATPIPALRDGDIQFSPAVPSQKVEAWKKVGMGAGLKIYLRFSKRFWPEHMKIILCADSFVPQIWFEERAFEPTKYFSQEHFVVCGFITGDQAEIVGKMKLNDAVEAFQHQLNSMFGTPAEPAPANTYFEDKMTHNWSKDPHIRCAYTYPTLMPLELRHELPKPVNGKLFFCGEATNTTQEIATLNGALESAKRVVDEVVAALPKKSAKL